LDAYFSAASRTITLLTQVWVAKSPQEAAELRHQAELQAADNAGPKLIQVSLALDRLLETVADVAKDMRDEGTRTIRNTSSSLLIGSFVIAFLNLFIGLRSAPSSVSPGQPLVRTESKEPAPFALPLEGTDPGVSRN
jgi:hypothetical protein